MAIPDLIPRDPKAPVRTRRALDKIADILDSMLLSGTFVITGAGTFGLGTGSFTGPVQASEFTANTQYTISSLSYLSALGVWEILALFSGGVHTATNASPISVNSVAHGLTTGDSVSIIGCLGNTAANGDWTVTRTDADNFTLTGSTGNGTYTTDSGNWASLASTFRLHNNIPGPTGPAWIVGCPDSVYQIGVGLQLEFYNPPGVHTLRNLFDVTYNTISVCDIDNMGSVSTKGWFSGSMTTLTYASSITIKVVPTAFDTDSISNTFKVTTTNAVGNATINASAAGSAGQWMSIHIVNDGTAPRQITFGTNFSTSGSVTGVVSQRVIVQFESDGTAWFERGRQYSNGPLFIGAPVAGGLAANVLFLDSSANLGQDNNRLTYTSATGILFSVKMQVYQGLGVATANLGGTIFDHYADVGNVTTGETDLYSDLIAASTLGTAGDKLEAEYGGTFVSSGTATREVRLYFAGSVIFDTGALTLSLSSAWTLYATLIRVSNTVVRYMISFTTEGAALSAYTAVGALTGIVLTNSNILKITGQAGGVGAATNDIVAKIGSVSWMPAA